MNEKKLLREQCAEAEGWKRVGDVVMRGARRLFNNCPEYGEDTVSGRALAVEMMQAHKIAVLPCVASPGFMAYQVERPQQSELGDTIAEAVARCRVAMVTCVCHAGSVCGSACARGRHHDGCARG